MSAAASCWAAFGAHGLILRSTANLNPSRPPLKHESHPQPRNKHPLGFQCQRGLVARLETGRKGQVLRNLDTIKRRIWAASPFE